MSDAGLAVEPPVARWQVHRRVARALARLREQEAVLAAVLALTVTCWFLVPLVLCDKLFSLTAAGYHVFLLWAALAALAIPYILWRAFSRRLNEPRAAVLADERLGLHARLSTAVTLDPREPSGFGAAFYAEAAERLAAVDPARAFPIRVPRLAGLLPVPLLIAGCLWYFVPAQDRLKLLARQEEKKKAETAQKQAVKKLLELEDMRKKEEEGQGHEKAADYRVNRLIQKAKDIAQQVEKGEKTREEAVVALAELKRELGENKDAPRPDKSLSERLKQLGPDKLNLGDGDLTRQVSSALQSGDVEEAARQMRRTAQKIKQDILDDKSKTDEQKKQELEKLQKEFQQLAEALGGEKALREGLQEVAQKSAEFQKFMEEIQKQENKDKTPDGKTAGELAQKLEEALENAADDLENAENQEGAEDAEEAAKEEEVAEALDEAMDGLCGNCNGQAGDKAGQGGKKPGSKGVRKSGSGNRVAKSKDGKAGGNKPGPGQNPNDQGGVGMGGGPGTGKRPYREADVEFKDEKLKGKLQAGAITSLKYFKGQGARSEAPADYKAALVAAESEATSALDLDRTPPDERDLVKDYFLNLRKDTGAGARPPAPAPPSSPAPSGKESLKE